MTHWQDCTPLEAHATFVAGTHDVKELYAGTTLGDAWRQSNGTFIENSPWQYRIREKIKSMLVEMPSPHSFGKISCSSDTDSIWLTFSSKDQANAAMQAIKAALDKA